MKAFPSFGNEIRCMDLAYVDKLAKDKICLKYLLVRQDLFDRTVDAKGMKKKRFQGNGLCIFDDDYKKVFPKIGLTRQQNLLESLKNYAKLKEYKFTLQ